jgi:hypothetical protein
MSDWEPSINDAMQQWPRSDSEIIAPPLPEVPIGVADDVTSDDEALDFAVEPGGDQGQTTCRADTHTQPRLAAI